MILSEIIMKSPFIPEIVNEEEQPVKRQYGRQYEKRDVHLNWWRFDASVNIVIAEVLLFHTQNKIN